MADVVSSLTIFLGSFFLLITSVVIGRKVGQWQIKTYPHDKLVVISVTEAAIFALLGLLVAFTFSSAYERFEERKVKIIDEVNAIDTAYSFFALLPSANQLVLRNDLRNYLDSRIAIYKNFHDNLQMTKELRNSIELKLKLWNETVKACQAFKDTATTQLVIPAVNNLFKIANTRFAITKIHPHIGIFILLFSLAVFASFLAGYSTAGKRGWNFIYISVYALMTSFVIYIVIELEYPRSGLINMNSFDQLLIDARNDLT